MHVSDALVSLQISVYQEQIALADFVRSSGPSKEWDAAVREEADRRQKSLEESERTLEARCAGRGPRARFPRSLVHVTKRQRDYR